MKLLLVTILTSQVLWIVLALAVGVWLSVSWILNYHWKSYGADMQITKRARLVYFSVSLIIVLSVAILIATL